MFVPQLHETEKMRIKSSSCPFVAASEKNIEKLICVSSIVSWGICLRIGLYLAPSTSTLKADLVTEENSIHEIPVATKFAN